MLISAVDVTLLAIDSTGLTIKLLHQTINVMHTQWYPEIVNKITKKTNLIVYVSRFFFRAVLLNL